MVAGMLGASVVYAGGHKAPADMHTFNVTCPAKELLPRIDFTYHRCNNGDEKSCESFVVFMRKALPEYDCQRSFDGDYVVPALWLSDAATEDYVRLLSNLKFIEARKLFGSAEFRAVLDGALAEEYEARSIAEEEKLRGAK